VVVFTISKGHCHHRLYHITPFQCILVIHCGGRTGRYMSFAYAIFMSVSSKATSKCIFPMYLNKKLPNVPPAVATFHLQCTLPKAKHKFISVISTPLFRTLAQKKKNYECVSRNPPREFSLHSKYECTAKSWLRSAGSLPHSPFPPKCW
jgi:hypothetical protein